MRDNFTGFRKLSAVGGHKRIKGEKKMGGRCREELVTSQLCRNLAKIVDEISRLWREGRKRLTLLN